MNSVSDTLETIIRVYTGATFTVTEGCSSPAQLEFFLSFLRERPSIRTIFEIGFNGGHSAFAFLSARDDIHVISLDLGAHPYVLDAKRLVDAHHPGRHTLLIGDSMRELKGRTADILVALPPDLIFIDGGHDDPIPMEDVFNCIAIARPGTWFIIDDVTESYWPIQRAVLKANLLGFLTVEGTYAENEHSIWVVAKRTEKSLPPAQLV